VISLGAAHFAPRPAKVLWILVWKFLITPRWSIILTEIKMCKMHLELACVALVLLFSIFIQHANARGCTFIIGPMQEVTETVDLKVYESMRADVCGNISVDNGFVDFYVTNPSGNIIFCCNKTSLSSFNFSAIENGTYTMHLANTAENDVTATLNYGVNFEVVLQQTIRIIATSQTTVVAPSPFWDVWGIIMEILKIITPAIIPEIPSFFRWLRWIKKYRKPRTPADFKPID
jgi:hypothetical protein